MNAGIEFLEFRPSEIAAAIAISVSYDTQIVLDIDKAISCFIQLVEKVRTFLGFVFRVFLLERIKQVNEIKFMNFVVLLFWVFRKEF